MTGLHMNIAATLESLVRKIPGAPAIRAPWTGDEVSFRELNAHTARLASGFAQAGISEGTRVLLLVPFGIDFISLAFSLFKAGAVPVLIDPGLGRKNTLHCIEQARPQAMIGVPLAHAVRRVFPAPFKTIRTFITLGGRWSFGGETLKDVLTHGTEEFASLPRGADHNAAILFTSGSTGPSKGVLYTHGMFSQQVNLLETVYGMQMGEVDLPTFPLFALFGISLGMTCILPRMDPTRPARVDPNEIVSPILKYRVTNSFGSPALWDVVTRHCLDRRITLPSLRRVLIAGAPVSPELLRRFDRILEGDAEAHTPYGATEALPVASIGRRQILEATESPASRGTLVGPPVPGLDVKIIRITDDPIAEWHEGLELPQGDMGEIVVKGPWVTRSYFNREGATRLAKIPDGDGFWHRMGDIGSLDAAGRLWFAGRKSHRVTLADRTLFSIPTEGVFNPHPEVRRAALVGIGPRGEQRPVIVVEPLSAKKLRQKSWQDKIRVELLQLARQSEETRAIRDILFHPEFPVDVRHNAKIGREKLARWAAAQLPAEPAAKA